jgi:hypothetical protein
MRIRATLYLLWPLRKLPMRRDLIALRCVGVCCTVLLCLAQAGATDSSSASKSSHKTPQRAAHKSAATPSTHKASSTVTMRKSVSSKSTRASNYATHSARTTASNRPSGNARTRTYTHASPAVLHTTSHRRTTAAERRLAHLREVSLRARERARLETEAAEPSALIDEPAPAHRFQIAEATPTPLRGSHESLLRQNLRSEDEGLERIEDEDDLNYRISEGMLVPVPTSLELAINGSLPENRRYCRPWTASFLTDLSHAHASEFKAPLMVTSAVRTVEYQRKLMEVNGNAAPAEGDIASPHLTGGSIDIAKSSMSKKEIAWMRRWLLPLQDLGQIDVEEEFKQACFHITVYNTYEPLPLPKPRVKRRTVKAEPITNETATRGE